MQKLNINYDASTVPEAFAGRDKMDRLSDKLEELMTHDSQNPEKSIAHTIETAIELYADTIEEAIGIAVLISNSIQNFRREIEEHNDKESDTVEAIEQKFGSMKNYMKFQKCEDCSVNGNCPTQKVADRVDISWRENRKLE